jgi:hypothetical protein
MLDPKSCLSWSVWLFEKPGFLKNIGQLSQFEAVPFEAVRVK